MSQINDRGFNFYHIQLDCNKIVLCHIGRYEESVLCPRYWTAALNRRNNNVN